MKKILISIKKNYLAFSYKKNTNATQAKLLNTNIISDNELVFSQDYIEKNTKLVAAFLKEICEQYNIHIISFQKNEMYNLLFDLFKKNQHIRVLYLFEEASLPYYICEGVIKSNYIKQLNCYNVPTFMIELLDKHNIEVTSRNEILFTSHFMEENNLTQFSKIFYKISVKLKLPIADKDLEDFETFCKINKYLRTIHLENTNIEDIDKILKILKKTKNGNIKLLIHDNIVDEKIITNLKKINKASKKYKISFKLVYSEDYLKNNVINQSLVSILKICGTIIGCLIFAVIGYVLYSNYDSMNKDVQIKEEISKVIEEAKKEEAEEIIDEPVEETPENVEQEEKTEENQTNNKKPNLVISNQYLSSLLTINEDTVGWLKVNNTNIDYPVVQAADNDYYLTRNFYKQNDKTGWVFMDYRNNPKELNQNTIFYAHNRFSNGVMFGTLQNTMKSSWYTNPDNQYIEFDTLYGKMKWRIFSIYKIDVTTDYLKTTFLDDASWLEFANMLKNRSIHNFGVEIKPGDKIITLSTCMGSNNQYRLVVHAVLEQ